MTASTLRVAAIQMHSGEDREKNFASASRLVAEAAERGATLVVLPEFFNRLGRIEFMVQEAETIPGPTSRFLSDLASQHRITLCGGSLCERSGEPGKGYNTSLLFDPDGNELARYRKLHLFDVDIPGQVSFRESQWIVPGEEVVATQTPQGCLGQATCYDLRFPELFRRLADRGMEILLFPSAFSAPTGRAHWEILLRARAIENQCFVIAANQVGRHTPRLATWGHSMVVDAWGQILAAGTDEPEAVVVADLDQARLQEIRRQLPALCHRKNLGHRENLAHRKS